MTKVPERVKAKCYRHPRYNPERDRYFASYRTTPQPGLVNSTSMAKQNLLTVIDQALAALQAAREALTTEPVLQGGKKPTAKPGSPRRGMSEEGRQRVAEAQRKRWAKHRRAAKKTARLAAK